MGGVDARVSVAGVSRFPSRIVCLTEETTETLYLLGEGDRVVGVSGYTIRPPEARRKPRVSAFINARFSKIVLPGDQLLLDVLQKRIVRGMGAYECSASVEGKRVARCELLCAGRKA